MASVDDVEDGGQTARGFVTHISEHELGHALHDLEVLVRVGCDPQQPVCDGKSTET